MFQKKKKNEVFIELSPIHNTSELKQTETTKLEIITFYNRSKSGANMMDKMQSEHTVKRRTSVHLFSA